MAASLLAQGQKLKAARLSSHRETGLLCQRKQGGRPSGLFPLRDRQGALADGLDGLNPRNTDSPTRKALKHGVQFPLRARRGVSGSPGWVRSSKSRPCIWEPSPPFTLDGVGGGFAREHLMKYGAKDNEIAVRIRGSQGDFLMSQEWKALRRAVVAHYGRRCMKCGTTPKDPRKTHVDHVKPRAKFPELKLDFNNLQVLCCRCNKDKGNKVADYRTLARTMEKTD